MHLLIWLKREYKVSTPAEVDSMISAEFPDPLTHPRLFTLVSEMMTHGPCGDSNPNSPCMKDRRCTKHFPKDFCDETMVSEDGYPRYRRRNTGRQHEVRGHLMDNRWVVPYSPYLLLKMECHINMELTFNVRSIKYIHKYLHKGHDRTTMEFGPNRDEVQQYLDARYVSAHEACWRFLERELHTQKPPVVALPVHEKDQHTVVFNPNNAQGAPPGVQNSKTKLMAYFETNCTDPHARTLFYVEMPQDYVWMKGRSLWQRRQLGFNIGRIHFAPPSSGEHFYMRTLLTVVKGATSFEDLRTFEGIEHPTYKEACLACGLLEDDQEWRLCLEEASGMQMGSQMRRLFATILAFCFPSDPRNLWNLFKDRICDDLRNQLRTRHHIQDPTDDQVHDFGLFLLDKILNQAGKSLAQFRDMPQFTGPWQQIEGNPFIAEQMAYDPSVERQSAAENIARLNPGQKSVHDQIFTSALRRDTQGRPQGSLFFVNGPGGTGKSFTWNTLASSCRARSLIVLCVASGIASLILTGGRTSHTMFGIPIDIHAELVSYIKKNSNKAALLKEASLIIWDEVPMQHHFALETVDRTLQDFLDQHNLPFGGITIAFGGDFQQTLPVIPRGTKEDIVGASIQRSVLWRHIKVLHLTENMRVDPTDHQSKEFACWLLDVGQGKDLPLNHFFTLPHHMLCDPNLSDLIQAIYPNIQNSDDFPDSYFLECAILSLRNIEVDEINSLVYSHFPGEGCVYSSADSVEANEDHTHYPVEYLNSINMGGFPLSQLEVKRGVPLMLLCNMDPGLGLCNGTRLWLINMTNRVLHLRIITGPCVGKLAFIP